MELPMALPDFLMSADGETRVVGTRISLFTILFDFNHGDSPEKIAANYTHIPLVAVYKLIAFYLENKPEVDAFLTAYRAELDRLRAAGPTVNLDELRARLARKKAAAAAESSS